MAPARNWFGGISPAPHFDELLAGDYALAQAEAGHNTIGDLFFDHTWDRYFSDDCLGFQCGGHAALLTR